MCECCCGGSEVVDGGCGCSIGKAILAIIALGVLGFLCWETYSLAVATYRFVNGMLDNTADFLIDWSPVIAGGAVVYLISSRARRRAPPRLTRVLALPKPQMLLPRGVVARIPLFRKVAEKQT